MKKDKKKERHMLKISVAAHEILKKRAAEERRSIISVIDMLCGV
jgi:hypothetical protein